MLLHMMRTTLVLDPALHARLKQQAAREGRTLSDVVERALRLGLAALAGGHRGRVTLPSYELGPYLVDPARRESFVGLVAGPQEEETP
jgi:hypothetical protein